MKLSVVIVNWNTKELLRKCLASIYAKTSGVLFEVIVIDNASSDGSADMVAGEFLQARLIRNSENRGFGAANNQGIVESKGEYVFFLNQDTELIENSLKYLTSRMEEDSRIGALGPKLLNSDLTLQKSCRRFPDTLSQALILFKFHNLFPNFPPISRYYMFDFNYESEREVDQLMGAAVMTRRQVLESVGGFDEAFYFWFEEVDWCKRVKDSGWKILYTPKISIIHHKGESQKALPNRQRFFSRGMLRYFRKHGPRIGYFVVLVLYPISILLSYLLSFVLKLGLPLKKRRYLL